MYNMERFKDEQFDFLKMNNLLDKVNLYKKQFSLYPSDNDIFLQFRWLSTPEGVLYWSNVSDKSNAFLFGIRRIYV